MTPTPTPTGADRDYDVREHDDDGMVLSKEKLDVGTRSEETGKVRLRKYVTTDHENVTVPREEGEGPHRARAARWYDSGR